MMLRRWILSAILLLAGFAHADWAADRDGSAGYVTVTTLATAVDEAVPFVVVYLSDMPADFWTAMDAASDTDGKTIRVSTADGTTQLACVPIGVNTSTDTGCLIFLGTGMSASVDVDYRIYVGNASLSMPTASGGMGEQAVFASYAGVYFPGVDTRDWTSGGRTLTAVNSPGTAASGYEGITAATYNGTSSYHSYSGTQALSDVPYTLEALAYSTSATANQCAVGLARSSSGTNGYALLRMRGDVASDIIRFSIINNSGSISEASTSTGYTTSTWCHVAGTRDLLTTGTTTAYINGGSAGTNTTNLGTAPTWDRLCIGATVISSVVNYLAGRVAFVGISASTRSADYMTTMQDNWAGTMYSAGAWTAASSCNSGSTGWVLLQTAGQSSTANVDWIDITNPLVDDATYAYCTVDDSPTTTEYLNLTNPDYGTTIPTGADSYTVTLRVKGYRGNSSGGDRLYDETIQFIDETGTRLGDNLAKTAEDWTTSATTRDYVVTGHTFDGTEFDADSGIAIRVDGADAVGTLAPRVVTAWIKIDWDCGDDAAAKVRGFFALTD